MVGDGLQVEARGWVAHEEWTADATTLLELGRRAPASAWCPRSQERTPPMTPRGWRYLSSGAACELLHGERVEDRGLGDGVAGRVAAGGQKFTVGDLRLRGAGYAAGASVAGMKNPARPFLGQSAWDGRVAGLLSRLWTHLIK